MFPNGSEFPSVNFPSLLSSLQSLLLLSALSEIPNAPVREPPFHARPIAAASPTSLRPRAILSGQ
jgi:hypothetical protein